MDFRRGVNIRHVHSDFKIIIYGGVNINCVRCCAHIKLSPAYYYINIVHALMIKAIPRGNFVEFYCIAEISLGTQRLFYGF